MTGALLALCALATFTRLAHADGVVLRIEDDKVYIDLGGKDGVGAGSELVVLHVITARDPVTGRALRDHFPLGSVTVIKAGDHLAVARAPEDIRHRIRVGDRIQLSSEPRVFADPWLETLARRRSERDQGGQTQAGGRVATGKRAADARKQAEAAIADAELARKAWQDTLGKPLDQRIATWQAYLAAHPRSPYSREVKAEIEKLQAEEIELDRLAREEAAPVATSEGEHARQRAVRLASLDPAAGADVPLVGRPPRNVYQGTEVPLAFTVLAPDKVDRAWVYYRRADRDSYRRIQLVSDGDGYLRGTLPGDAVEPPGIAYFVEIAAPGGEPVAALGSQGEPLRIAVSRAIEDRPPERRDRSRITVFVDYVDFDGRLGDGFDQYLHAEVDFMYRFYRPIYALRVGFGTLGGSGGPKNVIDESGGTCIDSAGVFRCRRVDYSYAYTEFEYRVSNTLALMLRPQFGSGTNDRRPDGSAGRCNGADLADCDLFSSLGLRAQVRIGEEKGTNLALGVGVTQSVGALFEAAFTWDVIPLFPIKLSAQVTDQPVPEDFGVRLIGDLGWRAVGWVYPSLRLAYQARDADHSGISGGLAVNFDW